jgi:hypothetical protein
LAFACHGLYRVGEIGAYRVSSAAEIAIAPLQSMLRLDRSLHGGIRPQVLYADVLRMDSSHVEPTDVGFVTLPSAAWSSNHHGHALPGDMAQAPTRAIMHRFCELLTQGV